MGRGLKKSKRGKSLFILAVVFTFSFLISQIVPVQATTWSWENYEGISQWVVAVTEDETGCGAAAPVTKNIPVVIKHKQDIAEISNFAHGSMKGRVAENIFSIAGRTIPDGQGTSKLEPLDIAFTPNCLSFKGRYRWDYADANMKCSGSTTLMGKRIDGKTCPGTAEKQLSQIAAARAASIEKEKLYNDILTKDPKNFWANWDMAELKKKQGKYDEYLKYIDTATNNEEIMQDTRAELKKQAANKLHLSEFPSATSSPLLRVEMGELDHWQGDFASNFKLPNPEVKKKEAWYWKYWTMFFPDSYDAVNKIVGVPEE